MSVVYLLTRGGPYDSTHVLASLAFQDGVLGGDVGRGRRGRHLPGAGAGGAGDLHAAHVAAGGGDLMQARSPARRSARRGRAPGRDPGLRGLRGVPVLLDGRSPRSSRTPTSSGRPQAQPVHLQPAADARALAHAVRRDALPAWLVEHAVRRASLVVLITLAARGAGGLRLARLTGRWGERLGIGDLPHLPGAADALFIPFSRLVVAARAAGHASGRWSSSIRRSRCPFCTWLLMGFFKSIPQGARGRGDGRRLHAGWRVHQAHGLPMSVPGHPDGRDLRASPW